MNTSNGNFQQTLLSNRTLPIITTAIDPQIYDRVATCGRNPRTITMDTTKEVITDAARRCAWVFRIPGHVSRTRRDGTIPRDFRVATRPPQDNGPVLIGDIAPLPKMGHIGSLEVLGNPYPQASARIPKFLMLLLTDILPMTGI